jgi:uncharacterized membrane protein YkvI
MNLVKTPLKENFKVAMLIISTIIGAGFSSGREIIQFYGRFGYGAFPLIALTGVLFFLMFYALLTIGIKARERKLESVQSLFFGKATGVADCVIMLNYVFVISAMLSGSDALFGSFTRLPIASAVTAVLTLILVSLGLKSLKSVNAVLTPVMLLMIAVIAVGTIIRPGNASPTDYLAVLGNSHAQIWYCLLYVGLNTLLSGGVIVELKADKKAVKKIALISSAVITVFMCLILLASFVAGRETIQAPMPVLAMAEKLGLGYAAIVIIWVGLFTTLAASAYVLSVWLKPVFKYRPLGLGVALTAGWLLGLIGFSRVVAITYPLSGAFGIIYCIFALMCLLKLSARDTAKKHGQKFFRNLEERAERMKTDMSDGAKKKRSVFNFGREPKDPELKRERELKRESEPKREPKAVDIEYVLEK